MPRITVPAADIELAEGEQYAGLILNAEVSRSAPLLAQVGSTDGLVATRHGED